MALEWGEKLLGMVLRGLPAIGNLVPRRFQQRALARLNEVNPFASIATNDDLLRALRLAWIEAALQIDGAVQQACTTPEWMAQSRDVQRFSTVLCSRLRALRNEALDRDLHPGHAPMDRHLRELIVAGPTAMMGDQPDAVEAMTQAFREIAAAVAGWPVHEVSALYEQMACRGLPAPGADARRSFGDLVYAVFADIIKSPSRYPEARQAFVIAIEGLGVELGQQCLALLRGQDAQLDRLLDALDIMGAEGGLEAWLERVDAEGAARWQSLSVQVADVDAKLTQQTATLNRMDETLAQVLAAVEAKGQLGGGPGQLAHDTVFALAKRLRPDDLLDLDRAVQELAAAVDVALDLIAKGHSAYYQDRFVDEVLARVRQSIEAGQLEQGAESIDQALAELDRREASERDAARRRRVQLLDASVSQAMLLRDPERVAGAVERLVGIDHPVRPATHGIFRDKLNAYYEEGRMRGLRLHLEVAEALARKLLAQVSGSDERGEALVLLGLALQTLGELESGTGRLREAVRAYQAALLEYTRKRAPLNWATTQNNLGNALAILGERERGTRRLREAVRAYQAALREYTRKRVPLDWAMAQHNLGNALAALGERESDTERLQESVQAYHAALQEYTRESVPLDWAMAQNNLGVALAAIGERERGTERLQEALQAYQAALEERERERERVPLDWAATQNNMGNALVTLGRRERSTERIQEAVQAFRAALQEYTRERAPLNWAMAQNNLGNALATIGESEVGTARLREAIQAYQAALQERKRERVPLEWARTQNNLGSALRIVGEREIGTARLREAVQAHQAALQEYTRERVPLDWARTQSNLGNALVTLGSREIGTARLDEAIQAYQAALTVITHDTLPSYLDAVRSNLAEVQRLLDERHRGPP